MSTSQEQDMSRRSTLVEGGRQVLEQAPRNVKGLFKGFIRFACSGNILEIAFGLIIASAFTSVTTSFVTDVLLPPLSVLFPLHKNLEEKFAVLRPGPNYVKEDGYNTLELARMDGAVILAYGVFLNRCINFLGLGLAIYGLANFYECVSRDPIIKHTVGCQYCKKVISNKATRCFNCTSWVDGREEQQYNDASRLPGSSGTGWRKPYRDEEGPSGETVTDL